MNHHKRFIALTAAILIIFIAAFASPLTALADDGAPPPGETPAAEGTEEAADPPVEAAPTEEQGGTAPAEDQVGTAQAEDQVSVAEIIGQIPDGTGLVILDAQGEIVPLAAEQAAEILATSDPIWCQDGITPDPTDPLCTPGFSDMASLLVWLTFFQPTADGTIWIEDLYDSSVDDIGATAFTIDGNSLTTWRNYALTIQGGWDGVTDSTTITGTSEFNVPVSVINWYDAVTVNDILVIDTSGTGLQVGTTGDITVSDVTADNNLGDGASLDNSAGTGDVSVTSSEFGQLLGPGNGERGLEVYSAGDISITDVNAYNNGYSGAYLDNTDGTGDILVDPGNFTDNGSSGGGAGLVARSAGDITLQNVMASDNTLSGAQLNNTFGTGDILVDTSGFNANGSLGDGSSSGGGLWVLSDGLVTLQTVQANSNYYDGARVVNSTGTGDILVDTIQANSNGASGGGGFVAFSAGDIDIQTLQANSNAFEGTYLNTLGGTGDVLIDTAQLNSNGVDGGNGLTAYSLGDIVIDALQANDNYYSGAMLDNSTGSGDTFIDAGQLNSNGDSGVTGSGLRIFSGGIIGVVDVQTNSNLEVGTVLNNTYGTGDVYVYANSSLTSDFNDNGTYGLYAISDGNISLTDVYANDNVLNDGAYLDNSGGTGGIYIYADNSINTSFSGNGTYGLYAQSRGSISLTDVVANGNVSGDGAFLNNTYGTGGIYVYADNSVNTSFSGNGVNGLYAQSGGVISLTDVVANGNTSGDGAFLNNTYGTGGVYIYADNSINTSFSGNGTYGLYAVSYGEISLTDVVANGNVSGDGAFLNNPFGTGGIYVYADNSINTSFSGNGVNGLYAQSGGDISLTDVVANGNTSGDGAFLNSTFGTGGVYVYADNSAATNFNGNGTYGLYAVSYGEISLTDVFADGNNSSGAYLNNASGTGDISVYSDNSSYTDFSGNGSTGLYALSHGDISLTDVFADGNNSNGAYLENTYGTGNISVNSADIFTYTDFSGNGSTGLYARSYGEVSLTDVLANGNGGSGALLDNRGGPGNIAVYADNWFFTGFSGNALNGLEAYSTSGYISLTDVNANGNGGSGALLDTTSGMGEIFVDPSVFDGNSNIGLQIFSRGDVTLLDVEADGNGSDGANVSILKCGGLTVDNSEFAGNGGYGLVVHQGGNLSLGTINFGGGNALGDAYIDYYDCKLPKKPVPALPPLPLHVVMVAGGEGIGLDCAQYRGTILVLPNGDRISLPCPLIDQASLGAVTADNLPRLLDHEFSFVSSMEALVTSSGQSISSLERPMTVGFFIPPREQNSILVILHWNGTQWEQLGGYRTIDNYFEAVANSTGTFVLVSRKPQ